MFSTLLIAAIIPSLALAFPAGAPPTRTSSISLSVPTTTSFISLSPISTPSSVQIHPNGNKAKCLDVKAAVYADGTPVDIYDCNGTGAQKWTINEANTKVKVAGTNFCLDAGATPANNVGMKIWTCYDNLPSQAWYCTDDNRISVTGKGQCLDLPNYSLANGNQVQTYQCTDGNTNQIWTTTS